MRRMLVCTALGVAALAGGCSSGDPGTDPVWVGAETVDAAEGPDAGWSNPTDGSARDSAAAADARDAAPRPECEWGGAPGECLSKSDCAALVDRTSEPGTCASGLLCCIVTPNVADDPPTPDGWQLMTQSEVTAAMTSWAVDVLHDPVTYPMFSTATRTFGTLQVLAVVEWHPPDFQNSIVHRGVTLFEPL